MKKKKKLKGFIIIACIFGGICYLGEQDKAENTFNDIANKVVNNETGQEINKESKEEIADKNQAFTNYENIIKRVFAISSERSVINLREDIEPYYDFINYKELLENKDLIYEYESVFINTHFTNEHDGLPYLVTQDMKVNFEKEGLRCRKLNKTDLKIEKNPKMYIGNEKYKSLDGTYFIYNEKPIVLEHYNKETNEVIGEYSFIMPMILSNTGKIKALSFYPETYRPFAELYYTQGETEGKGIAEVPMKENELVNGLMSN